MNYVFDPLLLISGGGLANDIHYVVRAYLYQRFGELPGNLRSLALDFATNPPRPPESAFATEIDAETWNAVEFRPHERALLSFSGNQQELAQRMDRGDHAVAHLSSMIPPDVLRDYSGAEGAQIPALTRAAMSYTAAGAESWYALLTRKIQSIARGSSIDAAIRGVNQDSSGRGARVVIIAGAQGGTGTGVTLPLAIAARWIARRLGLQIRVEAFIVAGKYREADGQEDRKGALNAVLDMDLTFASTPSRAVLKVPLGPDASATAEGRLFDTIIRQEAWDMFEHKTRDVTARAARTLTFRYFTKAAFDIQNSRGNSENRARLVPLTSRPVRDANSEQDLA